MERKVIPHCRYVSTDRAESHSSTMTFFICHFEVSLSNVICNDMDAFQCIVDKVPSSFLNSKAHANLLKFKLCKAPSGEIVGIPENHSVLPAFSLFPSIRLPVFCIFTLTTSELQACSQPSQNMRASKSIYKVGEGGEHARNL